MGILKKGSYICKTLFQTFDVYQNKYNASGSHCFGAANDNVALLTAPDRNGKP